MAYDVTLAWFATHHGVLSRQEARRLGLTDRQIYWSVKSGTWERLGRAVFRLAGAPMDNHALLRAAVLAAGESALASHWSAAWLWGITDRVVRPTVTVPHDRPRCPPGVAVTRSRIPARSVVHNGIPCTDVTRTLLDCAGQASAPDLDDLVDRAVARRLVRVEAIVKAAGDPRYRHHPGRCRLAERLSDRGVIGSPAPSVLESRMARLFTSFGLPPPRAELAWGPGGRYRLDFAYPQVRLAVEVDGWSAHFSPEQQRHDHHRYNSLASAGWTILRYSWQDVTYHPERVASEIAGVYWRLSSNRRA